MNEFTFSNTLRVLIGMAFFLEHHSYNPVIMDFFTDILRVKLKDPKEDIKTN